MKFLDLWVVLDAVHPLWVNKGGESEYFESKLERSICKYADSIVKYVTLDGEGVLAIELEER